MIRTVDLEVPSGDAGLPGTLAMPVRALGVVVFAHGSGSGRLSPRNASVARALQADGLATLLFDLLTEEEARDRHNVFDIALLARRLLRGVAVVRDREDVRELPVCLFGASTGGAAAIVAAADPKVAIASVVSRGGRPDLAGEALDRVAVPVMLIVGELDPHVLALNREAMAHMSRAATRLEVVPRAGHLFEEEGTLERVSVLASAWFREHL